MHTLYKISKYTIITFSVFITVNSFPGEELHKTSTQNQLKNQEAECFRLEKTIREDKNKDCHFQQECFDFDSEGIIESLRVLFKKSIMDKDYTNLINAICVIVIYQVKNKRRFDGRLKNIHNTPEKEIYQEIKRLIEDQDQEDGWVIVDDFELV